MTLYDTLQVCDWELLTFLFLLKKEQAESHGRWREVFNLLLLFRFFYLNHNVLSPTCTCTNTHMHNGISCRVDLQPLGPAKS